jgi:ABC-type sugar transport system substrate-binding protein
MKKLLAMSVMGLLALTSVTQQALAAEKKTICFVTFSLQIAYFQSSVAGGKRAAAEMGAELVDGIVVDPIESSALAGVIEEAGGRNIPIAVLDTPIDSPHVIANIGVPQYDASYQFGQYISGWIAGKLDGKANIGVMLASTEVQLLRRDGFVEALSALPGSKVVATGDGRNILERATAEAEDMLTGHPEINVIYATDDPQLQGGLAAAASQGRTIAFFGWDDIPEPFIKPLEDGRIVGFLKQKPGVGGETAVRYLVKHANGESVPNRFSYFPDVVTPYNLDSHR